MEVKRWKDAEKVRGKELVTEEKFNAWHGKWTDGSLPSESEWNEFFMAVSSLAQCTSCLCLTGLF